MIIIMINPENVFKQRNQHQNRLIKIYLYSIGLLIILKYCLCIESLVSKVALIENLPPHPNNPKNIFVSMTGLRVLDIFILL